MELPVCANSENVEQLLLFRGTKKVTVSAKIFALTYHWLKKESIKMPLGIDTTVLKLMRQSKFFFSNLSGMLFLDHIWRSYWRIFSIRYFEKLEKFNQRLYWPCQSRTTSAKNNVSFGYLIFRSLVLEQFERRSSDSKRFAKWEEEPRNGKKSCKRSRPFALYHLFFKIMTSFLRGVVFCCIGQQWNFGI